MVVEDIQLVLVVIFQYQLINFKELNKIILNKEINLIMEMDH
jgi:hypothetical protein